MSDGAGDDDEESARAVLAIAHGASGVDFLAYKSGTMHRRIRARMAMTRSSTFAAYRERLVDDENEVALLVRALLVKTTAMYRERRTFDLLRAHALGSLCARRVAEGASLLRAWVPACSTGEEAYTLAMCLLESAAGRPIACAVLASDVDLGALAKVDSGVYEGITAAALPSTFRERWLIEDDGKARVSPSLRAMVSSAHHDLLGSRYPAPREAVIASFDVVSCRNVLIYLRPEAQQIVAMRLLRACARGGLLVLGEAESPPANIRAALTPIDPKAPVYVVGETDRNA